MLKIIGKINIIVEFFLGTMHPFPAQLKIGEVVFFLISSGCQDFG